MVVISLKQDKMRFCCNCKHFISDSINGIEFGKCYAFPKVDVEYTDYLVSGMIDVDNSNNNYHYCGTARSNTDMCGEDGALYRKKYNKNLGNDDYSDNKKK